MSETGRAAAASNMSLARRAWNIRRKALLMGEVQGQGYIGQALGIADVLALLWQIFSVERSVAMGTRGPHIPRPPPRYPPPWSA